MATAMAMRMALDNSVTSRRQTGNHRERCIAMK